MAGLHPSSEAFSWQNGIASTLEVRSRSGPWRPRRLVYQVHRSYIPQVWCVKCVESYWIKTASCKLFWCLKDSACSGAKNSCLTRYPISEMLPRFFSLYTSPDLESARLGPRNPSLWRCALRSVPSFHQSVVVTEFVRSPLSWYTFW